ncbi:MAG: hypothetical protein AABZ47_18690 [Planctomycetota bacterium]
MLGSRMSFPKWILFPGLTIVSACTIQINPGDSGGNDNGGGPPDGTGGSERSLMVAFDAQGGNHAVATDDEGNEYTFRARQNPDGSTVLTEATVSMTNGIVVKASLDGQGRPVNLRGSDNTAADLVYEGDTVRVRLTHADGTVISDQAGLDSQAGRPIVDERRAKKLSKLAAQSQLGGSLVFSLTDGLSSFELVAVSVFDEEVNPGSVFVSSSLASATLLIGEISSVVEIVEVERVELVEVTLDVTPVEIRQLAGQTYVLFDAEGFCLDLAEIASRLTFDADGLLQSEFDRHLVFPDFSLGGSGEAGITINYDTGTPINLTPDSEVGFELFVTPVFTATQVDNFGTVTIERRFEAEVGFDADVFGSAVASATRLFDAALVNGSLSSDGDVLAFDLVLIDLADDTPVLATGRLRYRNQNAPEPVRLFDCELVTGEKALSTIVCPLEVATGDDFDVAFLSARSEGVFTFDWLVSDGFGFVIGDPNGDRTVIRPTASGFVEVTLVVSDLTTDDLSFEVYTCGVNVGRVLDDSIVDLDLAIDCPLGLNIGENGFVSVSGLDTLDLIQTEWFVLGTSDYFLSDPFELFTEIELFDAGRFEIVFQGFDFNDNEFFVGCEVIVGGIDFDECEEAGFYGDGICDDFCPQMDPDCEEFFDLCEINDYYGDGVCDEFCFEPDPDCTVIDIDLCEEAGLYGDGSCDLFCPFEDPDCASFDICEANGWYSDGFCDEFCNFPDPDCLTGGSDSCELLGLYGDGSCDDDCPLPDPDCFVDQDDICLINGFYGDGECDDFCPLPDPDCGFDNVDPCEVLGLYGDGTCDFVCPLPDPDCE